MHDLCTVWAAHWLWLQISVDHGPWHWMARHQDMMFINQKGLFVEAITTTPLKLRCRAPTVVHDSRLQHLTPSIDSTEIQTKCDWLGKFSSLPDETGHTCLEARWSFKLQGDAVLNKGDTWRNPAITKGKKWMTHDHSPFVSVGGYFQSTATGVLSSATSRPHDSTTFPLSVPLRP